jgi:Winged helix-turn helix
MVEEDGVRPQDPYQARIRAHIVLHAARGRSNAWMARETGLHLDTVRTWQCRFAEQGMPGPASRKCTGRPPSFTALQAVQVKTLACRLPAETRCRCRSGRVPGLARGAVQRGVAEAVSSSTVRCWLYQDALKPWQYRCWIFITDPASGPRPHAFSTCTPAPGKAGPGESEYVISADEKASIQARCRCHLSQMRWPPRGRGRK